MSSKLSRREFGGVAVSGAMAASAVAVGAQTQEPAKPQGEVRDWPEPSFKPQFRKPQLGRYLIQDFVIYAHSELDMVKLLLEKYPAVLNATVDWGGGDFETALGGASHLGRRDIAQFLIDRGARIDIFAAAMLGHIHAVKALVSSHPALIDAKGPHGIPLVSHAKAGGKEAEEVLKYLESLKKSP